MTLCGRISLSIDNGSRVISRPNVVTDAGAAFYAARGGGTVSMKLGTGSTAPARSGAGAVLGAYLPGSPRAAAVSVSGGTVTYTATWAAGVAVTTSLVSEVALTLDSSDATSSAANTIARALISPAIAKPAAESWTLTWTHTIGA